jgi:hypothetical protein
MMSSLDENIFGRVAILNNYLRPDQLDECLQIQRAAGPQRRIGDILREKGYLTEAQLKTILTIRQKKIRKVQRDLEELRKTDKSFGRLALQLGLITIDDLEAAILEQQRLSTLNLHFRLGEVFVANGKLQPSDVLDLLRRQGKRILICPVCDIHYNVVEYRENKVYRCVKCDTELSVPKFLDSVTVDAILEGS